MPKIITPEELLTTGKKETIPFSHTSICAKKRAKGSRIVAIGKEVNLESIKDVKEPLWIKWYNDSYLNLPVLK